MKTLMFPKPHKLTDKEKFAKKLQKLKEMKDRQIKRLKEGKKSQVIKAKQPKISELKKATQRKVNAYVRDRDKNKPCISCPKPLIKGHYDAGHFIAQGSCGALRYDLNNIHGQCDSCNRFKHGNLLEYRINLVNRIGETKVKDLEAHRHDIKKWTREELEAIEATIKHKEGVYQR